MGWVFARPSLTALEVAWRWLFGIPFLVVCWRQWLQILAAYPLQASGFNALDVQNPWVAVVQLANVVAYYQPPVLTVLRWLVPVAALVWCVVSAFGRSFVIRRMRPGLPFRPLQMIAMQAAWLALLFAVCLAWFRCMMWAAAAHIATVGEPDLIGFAIWTIFLGLGFFTAWALLSWTLEIAPLLMFFERRSVPSALVQSFSPGKEFASKLAEINLVMGIVKLALIVLAMVFAAAPLPFSDQLGGSAMHVVWSASTVFYLVANDYFQVVRLKGFAEFWQTYRATKSEDSHASA
jgi:hypothetical protein